MENVETIEQDPKLISSEEERFKLLNELECYASLKSEQVKKAENDHKKEWQTFKDCWELQRHIIKNFGLFGMKLGPFIFCKPGFFDHFFLVRDYPQRIPMSALLKLKEAINSQIFVSFAIIDPDVRNVKADPFLVGFKQRRWPSLEFDSWNDADQSPTLICWWLDKQS